MSCHVEANETDMYVVYDGIRITKRGHPNTPQATVSILPFVIGCGP
jgi:hypothetical protein